VSRTFRFISAGAGSGKTYRLTALLHEMLADSRVRPSGVLATTFTNKAAAELRERVRAHLLQQGQYGMATAIGQARIGTVNSVCGNLLERFAFEAGLPTEQRVLDEARANQVLKEVTDAVVEGSTLRELLVVARRLGLDSAGLVGEGEDPWELALSALVSRARANSIGPEALRGFGDRNADHLLGYFPMASTRDLSHDLKQAIAAVLPAVRAAARKGNKKVTSFYLKKLESAERLLNSGQLPWSAWNGLVNIEPEAALLDVVQPVKEVAGEHARHPQLQQDVRDYLGMMFSLAADVLDAYRERKRQLGAIDFTDQESELLQILDLPAVVETLTAELDLLMVDEFQDTSPIQLALFLKLAQYAKHVVWVGDVKQAIYGFRGGDAALMSAVLDRLPELEAEKEVLPYSWRSRPSLVELVNDVFGDAFLGMPASDVQLSAKRLEFEGTAALEDWWLAGKVDEQHQGIASGIAALMQGNTQIIDPATQQPRSLRLGDIVVLARSNSSVKAIAGVLQARQIMASTAQPGLLRRPEVVLALACLRRLNDERDTIATAEIVSLADCEDPEVWVADRLAWLARGEPESTWKEQAGTSHPIFRAIQTLREQKPLLAPREAMQILITRCDLSRRVLQWRPQADKARLRLTNLNRLIDVAAEYEDECRSAREAATLSGFLLWLKVLEEDQRDDLPQPAIDAVQVMTHHAAKGLEWPVVILMDLAGKVKDSIWNAVRAESLGTFDIQAPLEDRFLRYWPWPYGAQEKVAVGDDVETSAAGQVIRAAAVEEHKRLLYVSMTRARDLLVLARTEKKLTGEWMDTVGLARRLPADEVKELALAGGGRVPFRRRVVTPVSAEMAAPPAAGDLRWFEMPATRSAKLPLYVSPSVSSAPVAIVSRVAESVRIGRRVTTARGVEPTALGEAIHACLAAQLVAGDRPFGAEDVRGILARMGVGDAMAAEDLWRQLVAVVAWMEQRWPAATPWVEVPVTQGLSNGQRVNGRIDLLLQTPTGWILLDHKASPQGSQGWEALAQKYGGQLARYADAVTAVTGLPVIERWLVLPVAAAAVRLEAVAD